MVYAKLSLWQKTHIAAVSIFGVLLCISGFGVWFYRSLPYRIVVTSFSMHEAMTFLVIPVLLIHLTQIRKVKEFTQKGLKLST
jgi:nitrate reductase gamma subunit